MKPDAGDTLRVIADQFAFVDLPGMGPQVVKVNAIGSRIIAFMRGKSEAKISALLENVWNDSTKFKAAKSAIHDLNSALGFHRFTLTKISIVDNLH